MSDSITTAAPTERCDVQLRSTELFHEQQQVLFKRTDRMFAMLMVLQWVGAIAAAYWISPITWAGTDSQTHIHVWLAIIGGGAIASLPLLLAWRYPGRTITRHVIAIAQILFSCLLIHVCGGRIETHFHIFGSLAFLAIYRDWRVLVPATLITAADHLLRGWYFPQSVYGVLAASPWRWLEHSAWVLFEDVFLILSCRASVQEMWWTASRTAELEQTNLSVQEEIKQRTIALKKADEAAQAAEAASHAKSQFLANMSHEIRTPMNGIIGLTDLLLTTKLAKDQRSQLELVQTSADALMHVLNDILDFSKIEAGKLEMDPVTFDLREVIGDTAKLFGLRAHQKGVELAYRVRPAVPEYLIGDAGRLRQVLVNLVGNALKFTDKGEVVLDLDLEELNSEEACLHFRIKDTGVGISKEKLQEIFEAFTQADGTMSRKYGGTGLGLTITRRLVEMMGGRVWVESELGKGSLFHFTVRFGRTNETKQSQLRAPRRVESFDGLRVLIVDDHPTNRVILEEMTQNWRMEPTVVGHGHDAIEAIQTANDSGQPFALVLLDAHMPEINGFEVAESIRNELGLNELKLMMLSSDDCGDYVTRCKELNLAAKLVKPVKQSELLDSIVTVLDAPLPGAQRFEGLTKLGSEDQVQEIRRPKHSLRILLAEDNFVNQQVMIRILEREDHQVLVANNGREALELSRQEQVDLILMDVQMPEMSGLEATAAIRADEANSERHLPIIALTAHAMKDDRDKCLKAGMDNYLSKPIQVNELMTVLADMFGEEGSESDLAEQTDGVSTKSLDRADLLRRVGDDAEFLATMAGYFSEDSVERMAEAHKALEQNNSDKLRQAAHSLKGSAGNIGGSKVAAVALELETLAREERMDEGEQVIAKLERDLAELQSELATFVEELQATPA